MTKELLVDVVTEDVDIRFAPVAEAQTNEETSKLRQIRGVAGKSGVINRNRRMYTKQVYDSAVRKAQTQIRNRKFLGEVEHPEYGRGSLMRSAIRFTKLEMVGDEMRFEAVVLPTPAGEVVEGLIEGGVGLGVSTRGYASIDYRTVGDERVAFVNDDYELTGIDLVLNESNPFGRVQQTESEGGNEQMTLEELKAKHPELVKQIEESAVEEARTEIEAELKEGLEKEFDTRVANAVESRKDELEESIRKELTESEEIKEAQEIVANIVKALGDKAPKVAQKVEESEEMKELKQIKESFDSMKQEFEDLKKEKELLEAEQEEAKEKEKVAEAIDKALEGERFAKQIREQLEECKTVEEVDAKVGKAKAFVESIMKAQGINVEGSGETNAEKENKLNENVDSEIERQKRLAGL